ncbi:GntR family transcriptional regulator [Nonomuraea fuscirosea]|uniref:GntR family transcriptional regulator n=1 Tax=Nonomuraea fuscirosea TaxID=1291556 RepID=UPI000D06F9EF|nr:GntR family transcriptional regulator [Nonomuraea fuscirosea]
MPNREGETYLYLQISEVIKARIVADLAPGDLVISEAGIQQEFKVARTTARRAIRVLRNQGLVHTRQGEGTFVNAPGQTGPSGRQTPFYRYIADELRKRIRSGDLVPSKPLPSEVDLVREFRAARETVRRALTLLREEGWVYRIPHRGSFVAPVEQWPVSE